MSYDVSVWSSSRPLTVDEAARIDNALADGAFDGLEADDRVGRFHAQLCERYPSVDDPDTARAERSPWTAGLDVSDRHVGITIAYSRVKEVLPAIARLALNLGLVCFDPQLPRISQKVPEGTASRSVLQTENGSVTLNASTDAIYSVLTSLKDPINSYAIFERGDSRYIQAKVDAMGAWVLECRDGAADQHYAAASPTLADVARSFAAFAGDGDVWKQGLTWRKVKI
jgi:hypothetical protein